MPSAPRFTIRHTSRPSSPAVGAPGEVDLECPGRRDGPDVSGGGLDGHHHRLRFRRSRRQFWARPGTASLFPCLQPSRPGLWGYPAPARARQTPVETVWREDVSGHIAESGYGESSVFHAPSWQLAAVANQHGGRVVPDVAGKADFEFGYELVIGDQHVPGCGTSAAAPLWASLAALLNEKLKTTVGHITPLLYDQRCRAGIEPVGSSKTAWAPKVGLGTPRGDALLEALRK